LAGKIHENFKKTSKIIFPYCSDLDQFEPANLILMVFVIFYLRGGVLMNTRKTTLLVVLFVGLSSFFVVQAKSKNAASGTSVYSKGGQNVLEAAGKFVHATKAEIQDTKLEKFDGTGASLLTWAEGHSKYFSITEDNQTWSAPQQADYRLVFKYQSFDPVQAFAPQFSAPKTNLHIVQFSAQPVEAFRQQIRELGGTIYKYVPNYAYIVKMNPATADLVKALPFVRFAGPLAPELRLQGSLVAFAAQKDGLTTKVNVMAVDESEKTQLARDIKLLGGTVLKTLPGSEMLQASLTNEQIHKVSSLDSVLWIDRETEITNDIDKARIQGGADHMIRQVEGYTGKGIRGHVIEGIYADHPAFKANGNREAPIAIDDAEPDGHGMNTFGEIFGNDPARPDARGIIPDAQGLYTNRNAFVDGDASRYDLVKKLMATQRVMFQTASWGHAQTLEYTSQSADIDRLIFDLDLPITQSQSNMGSRMSRPQAWAKNIISVGALEHHETVNPEDDTWQQTASIGPAKDGRIKPDLAAYYDGILTTDGPDGYTEEFGGTSGATPIVAGYVGLSIEMWTNGIFGNTLPAPKSDRFANRPHATTTKALLINSAKQYSFDSAVHDRTRVHQGWGFPNMQNLFERRTKTLVVNETDVLKNLASKTYTVNVARGQDEFKATLVYADPAPAVLTGQQLVNDLTLKVTAPDGTVYWGNVGLLEGMYSKSGGTANKIDNVENVFVNAPAAGAWTVTVSADSVNVDGHKETREVDADFALVVSGAAQAR
jgi:serine protease AprX